MFNSTNMYSIKNYATVANKTVTFTMLYVMDVCQRYPTLYEFALKNADSEMAGLVMRVTYLAAMFVILRGILRMFMDPLNLKRDAKFVELREELSDSEKYYNELYDEKCDAEAEINLLIKEIAMLNDKLTEANKALVDVKTQYLCCRNAAQALIDATSESDTQG